MSDNLEISDIMDATQMLTTEIEFMSNELNRVFLGKVLSRYRQAVELFVSTAEENETSVELCKKMFLFGYRRALLDNQLEMLLGGQNENGQ